MFTYVPELWGSPFFTHSSILQSQNSCIFLFLDGFSLSQSIIISTVHDSIVTKFQHTGNLRSGERLFGQHRKESFLFNKQVSPKNTLLWNKVNRCLARYSPRATTTNRPTNRAPNMPAWPGPN